MFIIAVDFFFNSDFIKTENYFLFCCSFILSPFKTNSFMILLNCGSLLLILYNYFKIYGISHVYLFLLIILLLAPITQHTHTHNYRFLLPIACLQHFSWNYLCPFVFISSWKLTLFFNHRLIMIIWAFLTM